VANITNIELDSLPIVLIDLSIFLNALVSFGLISLVVIRILSKAGVRIGGIVLY